MYNDEPGITVLVHTTDEKVIEWNYDLVVRAFPEIVDQTGSKFDGYNGKLHIDLPLTSLTVKYLGELFLDQKSNEINMHAIDVCLRDLAGHPGWLRIVRELLTKSITCLNYKNCISIWRLCKRFDHYKTKWLERYITYNLVDQISTVALGFFRLSIDELIYFISSDYLHIQSEDDVVRLIENYVKADENTRSHHYPLLFSHIRARYLLNLPISPETRNLLEVNGDKMKKERIHRDLFLVFGGTIAGAYQPYPAYFNHDSSSWHELISLGLPAPLVYHAVVVLNGIVYVFGGGDNQEAYSKKMWRLEHGTWIRCADMNDKRANMSNMVVTYDKKIYVMGGNQHFVTRLNTAECYDPENDTWNTLPDMPHARADGAACVLGDRIYVSGGLTSNRVLTEIDVYLPREREWRAAGTLPVGLSGHSMTAEESPSGASLSIYGGYNGKERLIRVYKKKFTEKEWILQKSMNTARSSASLMPYGKKDLVIFGGNNGRGAFAERWDGENWEVMKSCDVEREGSRVVLIPDFFHEIHEY